jgi:hypothetical protein
MKDATAVKKKVSTRELFEGFPVARSVFYIAGIAFTAFNFGAYLVATISPSLLIAWLNLSQPFTDWVARFYPAVDPAMVNLVRAHKAYLIPINRNVVLIDAALAIAFLFPFSVGVGVDVLISPTTAVARAKRIADKLQAGIPELILRTGSWVLIAGALLYSGMVIEPWSISILRSITGYYVMFGVTLWCGLLMVYFMAFWLMLRSATDRAGNRYDSQIM